MLAGPASGLPAQPEFRELTAADLLVAGARPYEFLYVDAALTVQQSPNVQYRGGWQVQKNNGPPVLADLNENEWVHCYEAGSP